MSATGNRLIKDVFLPVRKRLLSLSLFFSLLSFPSTPFPPSSFYYLRLLFLSLSQEIYTPWHCLIGAAAARLRGIIVNLEL